MVKDPAWKRVLGGVVGIVIVLCIVLLLRQRGVSGDDMQQWETVIVMTAAAAFGVRWFVKRRQRRGR
jgi:hypothetical protein